MHPVYVHLAMDWLKAEQQANPSEWEGRVFDRDAMSVAVDRVIAVVSGQVAWQDTSPGDKAVWKSRVTDVPMFERAWRAREDSDESPDRQAILQRVRQEWDDEFTTNTTSRSTGTPGTPTISPRLHSVRERLWWTWYDTLEGIGGLALNHTRLFGNHNIGNIFLTNLQSAGMLAYSDGNFLICAVYASISSLEALHWAADNVGFELQIGDKRSLPTLFMRDMFRGIDLLATGRLPLMVPVRQNVSVATFWRRTPPADLAPFDVTYHLEGLLTRDVY